VPRAGRRRSTKKAFDALCRISPATTTQTPGHSAPGADSHSRLPSGLVRRSTDGIADCDRPGGLLLTAEAVTNSSIRPACAVHLDLDGAEHIFRVHGWPYGADRDRLFESGLRSALDLFSELDIKATLFVIAEDLGDPSKLQLLREAVELGHEVASHTTTHRLLTHLRPSERREEIHDSRSRLMQTLGAAVEGFRAPAFDVDIDVLRDVSEAGYVWDSSLFPTSGTSHGLPPIEAAPHRLALDTPLVELPLPRYSPLPLPFHPSYSFVLGIWYFRWGLRRFQRTHAPMVLLFHLTEFSEPLRRADIPGLRARLYTLSHLSRSTKLALCRLTLDEVRPTYRIVTTSALWADWVT